MPSEMGNTMIGYRRVIHLQAAERRDFGERLESRVGDLSVAEIEELELG